MSLTKKLFALALLTGGLCFMGVLHPRQAVAEGSGAGGACSSCSSQMTECTNQVIASCTSQCGSDAGCFRTCESGGFAECEAQVDACLEHCVN